jgi:endo-1,4-beta-xylanase
MRHISNRFIAVLAAAFALTFVQAAFAQTAVLKSDFESGQDNWTYRGDKGAEETVAVSTEEQHSGAASLKISKRTKTWHGAVHQLTDTLKAGTIYDISAWIKYSAGPSTGSFTVSAELDGKNKSRDYHNLAGATVKKGEWTKLEGSLTIPDDPNLDHILVYFETQYKADNLVTPDDTVDFYVDDILVAKRTKNIVVQDDIPALRDIVGSSFALGAAVSPDLLDASNPHRKLILKHFDAMVAGNAMKPESLEPKEGTFNFAPADKIADFASLTGMRLRGHTLVWHNQTPAWFFADSADPAKSATKEVLLAREKAYIQAVVGHYKGQVKSWDVVNEVLSDGSGLRTGKDNSKWFDIAGADYIEKAFVWAHQADPDAELVINDYNLESSAAKREAMYALVKGLLAKKVPVNGIGIQMHISVGAPSIAEIKTTIERFAELGVKVLVTELDVSIYESSSEAYRDPSPAVLAAQAKRYADLFALFKEEAAKKRLDTVILWGSADDDSWLDDFPVRGRKNAPLLFDRDLQAKPAYWAIVDPKRVGL